MKKSVLLLLGGGLVVLASGAVLITGSAGPAGAAGPAIRMPQMDPARGRKLFASKGCVVCHSVNGVGGEDAPAFDARDMPVPMNPFDFAAKMWRGARTMIVMQQDELGEQIDFTGDELADIIAFVHSADEQKKFSKADIPPRIAKLMNHLGDESDEHERKEHRGGMGMMKNRKMMR